MRWHFLFVCATGSQSVFLKLHFYTFWTPNGERDSYGFSFGLLWFSGNEISMKYSFLSTSSNGRTVQCNEMFNVHCSHFSYEKCETHECFFHTYFVCFCSLLSPNVTNESNDRAVSNKMWFSMKYEVWMCIFHFSNQRFFWLHENWIEICWTADTMQFFVVAINVARFSSQFRFNFILFYAIFEWRNYVREVSDLWAF